MEDPILKNLSGKTIGLLGGSFNPAHDGHLQISKGALKLLELDQVWWLISPGNPLKENSSLPSIEDRSKRALKIIGTEPITPTGIEVVFGTIFTIDTITSLQKSCPDAKFIWLMGEDNMIEFSQWKSWKKIIRALPIAIFKREGYSTKARGGKMAVEFKNQNIPSHDIGSLKDREPPAWGYVPNQLNPMSSTKIREDAVQEIKKDPPLDITQDSLTSSNPPRQRSSEDLLALVINTLDDNKAVDIITLDLKGNTSIADFMVVATGTSKRQVAALADYLARELKTQGHGAPKIEGLEQADWVLLDSGDVIIHLFRPEVRSFYNIEKMWSVDIDLDPQTH
jgi:nicotinate-nucleotide adenylyltransferase